MVSKLFGGWFWGLVLMVVGFVWLLDNLGVIYFDFGDLVGSIWPIAIIAVGVWMLWGGRSKEVVTGGPSPQRIKHGLGDLDMSPDSISEQGLDLRMGAGEVELDLTKTRLQDKENVVAIKIGLGDMRIRVPSEVPVSVHGRTGVGDLHLLGHDADGFAAQLNHQDATYDTATKKLRIVARSGLGDIKVTRG